MYGYTFIEIDILTQKITQKIDLKPKWLSLRRVSDINYIGVNVFNNGLHYFIANTNIVGIFDPQTAEIIDFYEFDFDKKKYQQLRGGAENLQVKDGKIYVLDSLGNLYELERE